MSILPQSTQILVIGGGPAGSTAATLLAREGFDVTLMEKEVGARYHIGESLLPSCMEILELTGAKEKVEAYGFQRKDGAYFKWGSDEWSFNFGQLNGNQKHSYQVRRAEFDKLLLDHASSQRVKVFEGVEVRKLLFNRDRPKSAIWLQRSAGNVSGELNFDFLIDASGRAGLMATRYLNNRRQNKVFQNIAMWGYWKGATRVAEAPEGSLVVGSIPNGWLWAIPLDNETTNVGVVIDKETYKEKRLGNLDKFYFDAIAECPLVANLLQQADLQSSVEVDQDYSYAAEAFCGPGYFLIGDAACFLDPLLSTGVHLANFSALLVSASIASILRHEFKEEQVLSFYEKSYRQAYLRFLTLISFFYDKKSNKNDYYQEAKNLTLDDNQSNAPNTAFVNLVSGMEDLSEARIGTNNLITEKISQRVAKSLSLKQLQEDVDDENIDPQFMNVMEGMYSFSKNLSAEEAVDGLHIITKPRLGLSSILTKIGHSCED